MHLDDLDVEAGPKPRRALDSARGCSHRYSCSARRRPGRGRAYAQLGRLGVAKPVVPTTAPAPAARTREMGEVPSGRVKSMSTSATRTAASTSVPTLTPSPRPKRSPASRPATGTARRRRRRRALRDQRAPLRSAPGPSGRPRPQPRSHRGGHCFLKMSRNCSHHERGSDHAASPAVIAAADLLSSAIEIGISSPSQRASLSSTK